MNLVEFHHSRLPTAPIYEVPQSLRSCDRFVCPSTQSPNMAYLFIGLISILVLVVTVFFPIIHLIVVLED